jgi:FlaA1/EpsC-like NDP-sugar epimerase
MIITLFILPFQQFFPHVPRSVPFIFAPLALFATAGPRFLLRVLVQHQIRSRQTALAAAMNNGTVEKRSDVRIAVMGAGHAGSMIVRELRQHPNPDGRVVGFLDDDPRKHKLHIHGLPVLGGRYDIPRLVSELDIHQIIIAVPEASGKDIREIVDICEHANVKPRVMPALYELIDGTVNFSQIRDVQIEDLLRREPVETDLDAIEALVQGKRVLVTGAGGSIGGELSRQLLRLGPAELIIVGHGENSIFEVHNELNKMLATLPEHIKAHCKIQPVIADIRFAGRIRHVFEKYQPQIVFHAAAHKHVPLMEHNPSEAITNNLLGTRNLVEGARTVDVEHFVMISTDKAVNPTSIMGASKRMCELIVHQAAQQTQKPYMVVRFGNVLGSRGSVIQTFRKQIAAGGPITVTHPDIRRYFMTIPEAVQLVLQAAVIGKGGEVFTLDMGEQIKIADLARDMIELSGLEVGKDIDITFTGLRPGEKLYEELFLPDEAFERTQHKKIFIAADANSFVPEHLDHWVHSLALSAEQEDFETILLLLRRLIPHHQLKQLLPAELEATTSQTQQPTIELPSARQRSENAEPEKSQEPLRVRVVGA